MRRERALLHALTDKRSAPSTILALLEAAAVRFRDALAQRQHPRDPLRFARLAGLLARERLRAHAATAGSFSAAADAVK